MTRVEAQRGGGHGEQEHVHTLGRPYVSKSQRQQQHKAVQHPVRQASVLSSLLLSSTTYTRQIEKRGRNARRWEEMKEEEMGGENEIWLFVYCLSSTGVLQHIQISSHCVCGRPVTMGMKRHSVLAEIRAFRKHYASFNNTLPSPIISVACLLVHLWADCYLFVTLTIFPEPQKGQKITPSQWNQMCYKSGRPIVTHVHTKYMYILAIMM